MSADTGIPGQTFQNKHKTRTQPGNEYGFLLANGH
jgi:hypothetical protein